MSHKSEHRLFMEYAAVAILGLVITAVVIWVTVHEMKLPPIDGKTISVLICFVSDSTTAQCVVFSNNTNDAAAASPESANRISRRLKIDVLNNIAARSRDNPGDQHVTAVRIRAPSAATTKALKICSAAFQRAKMPL